MVHDLIQGKRLSIAFVYFVGPASVTTDLVYAAFQVKFSYFVCELTECISIAVYTGGLAKNHFWLVATQKNRIREQPNYF